MPGTLWRFSLHSRSKNPLTIPPIRILKYGELDFIPCSWYRMSILECSGGTSLCIGSSARKRRVMLQCSSCMNRDICWLRFWSAHQFLITTERYTTSRCPRTRCRQLAIDLSMPGLFDAEKLDSVVVRVTAIEEFHWVFRIFFNFVDRIGSLTQRYKWSWIIEEKEGKELGLME